MLIIIRIFAIIIMIVFTTLYVGRTTFGDNPFTIVMERPYRALAVFLMILGMIVFIYFAVDKELLNK